MASENASKKGKKGKTMGLMDFLSTPTDNESWAEPETSTLPSAPASINPASNIPEGSSALTFSSRYSSSSRSQVASTPSFKPIDMSKIPTIPPFNAFIGNLPFDTEQQDVVDLLNDNTDKDVSDSNSITNVKLIRDREGKLKGFGYVEFASREALQKALERQGNLSIRGRSIRIDIADSDHGDHSNPTRSRDSISGFGRQSRNERQDVDRSSITPEASWRRTIHIPTNDGSHGHDRYQRSSDLNRQKSGSEAIHSRFAASDSNFGGDLSSWRRSESIISSEENVDSTESTREKQSNGYPSANRPQTLEHRRRTDSGFHKKTHASLRVDSPSITERSWRN